MPVIPAIGRLRQEDHELHSKTVSFNTREKRKKEKKIDKTSELGAHYKNQFCER